MNRLIFRSRLLAFFFIRKCRVLLLRLNIGDREHKADVLVAEFAAERHFIIADNILNCPDTLLLEGLEELRLGYVSSSRFLILQLLCELLRQDYVSYWQIYKR